MQQVGSQFPDGIKPTTPELEAVFTAEPQGKSLLEFWGFFLPFFFFEKLFCGKIYIKISIFTTLKCIFLWH